MNSHFIVCQLPITSLLSAVPKKNAGFYRLDAFCFTWPAVSKHWADLENWCAFTENHPLSSFFLDALADSSVSCSYISYTGLLFLLLSVCRSLSVERSILDTGFSPRPCVGRLIQSVLWQNGWVDHDAVWGGEWGQSIDVFIRFGWWTSNGKGQFWGWICGIPL